MLGLSYTIPMYNCWKQFPQKKALVTGVILCGFGFGGMVFGLVATLVINPDNLSFDDPKVF